MRFHLNLDPARLPVGAHPDQAESSLAANNNGESTATEARRAVAGAARRSLVPVLRVAVPSLPRTPTAPPDPAWFSAPLLTGRTLVVPSGARVRGDCRAEHVWVLGEVDGRVHATAGALVVAAGARVRGRVEGAGAVVIAGQVEARRGPLAVVAHGRLDIACSARISGTVMHGVVALYEGAFIDGDLVPVDTAGLR